VWVVCWLVGQTDERFAGQSTATTTIPFFRGRLVIPPTGITNHSGQIVQIKSDPRPGINSLIRNRRTSLASQAPPAQADLRIIT
jgi:hypothetical protein